MQKKTKPTGEILKDIGEIVDILKEIAYMENMKKEEALRRLDLRSKCNLNNLKDLNNANEPNKPK